MKATAAVLFPMYLIVLLALSICGGCATPGDGDMPWAAPEPWQGNPGIPGMPTE